MNQPPAAAARKRLLVLATTFPAHSGDGVPAFVLDIAREQAREFDVTVVTPRVAGAAARERIDGVDIRRFAYFPRRWERLADGAILDNLRARRSNWLQVVPLLLAQFRAVRKAVRELHPDAVHSHWIVPAAIAARFGARRLPQIVTAHGGDLYALNSAPFRRAKSGVLRRARAITTVNAEMAQRLATWGIDTDKVTVLPMGVPLDEAMAVRAAVDPAPGRVTVVGRLVEKKGFTNILAALRERGATDWNLTVVGDGPLRHDLERQAAGSPVRFVGQAARGEVLRQMGRSTVFVIPSITATSGDQEGLPVVLLEAAAMGCAIVASDLPGINEALTNEESALLVPAGDVAALAEAVSRLLADPALRERLGAGAVERARDYGLDRIGSRYRDVVRTAIDSA